jgi:ABC-type branched-subunit amino acid transport system substrate-binding protein
MSPSRPSRTRPAPRPPRTTASAIAVAVTLAISLALSACGRLPGVGIGAPAPGATGSGGVRTGVGVTDDTITLGALTDETGPYATAGRSITNAAQLYYARVNAAGGICGRRVELLVRDHGYDVDAAVAAYTEVEPQVLGFEQLLGSPMTAALLTNIESDRVLTAPASWASTLLTNPYVAVMGTTYDVETINAYDYLTRTKGLRRGDVVGHVYVGGEYGDNALLGSKDAAARQGLTVREVRIKPTDENLATQMAGLKAAKVRAVVLTTGPKQTASAVGAATVLGLGVPIIGNSPSYSSALLRTPVAAALAAHFTLLGSAAPVSTDLPEIHKVVQAYRAAYPQAAVDSSVVYGYGAAVAYAEILRAACANGDLTRDGVVSAFRAAKHIDTGGLLAPLDFSRRGASPAVQIYVSRPDASVEGGLSVVEPLFAADAASTYRAPAES